VTWALIGWALAAAGWLVGVPAWLTLRRRRELVADVEHELRGPTAALELVCERMRRRPASSVNVAMVESQLACGPSPRS
jgi:signal transduction histidine kinase